MIYRVTDPEQVKNLVADWNETVVKTCLAGRLGSIWSTKCADHESVLLVVGEFILFAGVPSRELVAFVPEGYRSHFAIMVAKGDDDRWHRLIEEVYGADARRIERYSIKKEGVSSFNISKLQAMASALPEGYRLTMIDRALYNFCREDADFGDFVSQYPTFEDFEKYAFGVIALRGDEPAAGCSSFADYPGGIEIEIATKPAHRRLGLACATAARFILESIERGIYPSWDAANLSSLALAEKLGYRLNRSYPAYEIYNYNY